ncbi:uncharacterized protein LOC107365781 [Tetranychus urticae]|uniref:Uncharacterized protein n=1 Tax=Tetranychus urticae TaxID=32264 RepID=T1KNS2_TETUR|nr:uncharacterized protein LOC107365781 [Tetranychus urticae]
MSGNNDYPSKVTIKMRPSDEDYQDITIDWSDESCEHKQQLFFRKIASFIGLPAKYLSSIYINHTTTLIPLYNTESNFQYDPPRVNDTFWRSLNDGDCFLLRSWLRLIDHECLFDLHIDIFSAQREDIHPTQCTLLYCQTINSRSYLNKRKEIILNSAIFPQIRAGFPEQRLGLPDEDLWKKTLVNFNIRQYFNPACCRVLFGGVNDRHEREYLPHRG